MLGWKQGQVARFDLVLRQMMLGGKDVVQR